MWGGDMKATASGTESVQNSPLQECQREVEALQAALAVAREQARVAEVCSQSAAQHSQALENANQALQQRDHLLETTAIVANTLLTVSPFDLAVNTAL